MEYLALLVLIVFFVWCCLPSEEEIQKILDRELISFGLEDEQKHFPYTGGRK